VFYTDDSAELLRADERASFDELIDVDGDYPAKAAYRVANAMHFKTPVDIAIADHAPERKFIRKLCDRANAPFIDAWLKSTDRDFYPIEYSWKRGEHSKRGQFSPDFFIKQGRHVHVVEIKDDAEVAEPTEEIKKKREFAAAHVDRLNNLQSGLIYTLNFLTPQDFDVFFQKLRDSDLDSYASHLDVALVA
jgi:type III restriction enzyme